MSSDHSITKEQPQPTPPPSTGGGDGPVSRKERLREKALRYKEKFTTREGWLGELEGLQISLNATRQKLQQIDDIATMQQTATHLGMPTFPDTAGRVILPFRRIFVVAQKPDLVTV